MPLRPDIWTSQPQLLSLAQISILPYKCQWSSPLHSTKNLSLGFKSRSHIVTYECDFHKMLVHDCRMKYPPVRRNMEWTYAKKKMEEVGEEYWVQQLLKITNIVSQEIKNYHNCIQLYIVIVNK